MCICIPSDITWIACFWMHVNIILWLCPAWVCCSCDEVQIDSRGGRSPVCPRTLSLLNHTQTENNLPHSWCNGVQWLHHRSILIIHCTLAVMIAEATEINLAKVSMHTSVTCAPALMCVHFSFQSITKPGTCYVFAFMHMCTFYFVYI